MTTGYRSDQFFNIESSRPDRWSGNNPDVFVNRGALNRAFRYPDNVIRTTDAAGNHTTSVLKKGYIRRINEFDDSASGPVICRFQFNPQFINQQASFNSSITNPIYQPIEQLQQPIASMTNFSIRLYFDRSMELNTNSSISLPRASDNPWERYGPEQVGVLHDINALYRVIGQGISSSDVAAALERAAESLAAGDLRLNRDDITPEERQTYNSAVSNASSFFDNNVNVGNTAFILPYPVRLVFSSLYIVEGFVTNTALEILKFNSSYVPMIAQVTLGVSAIYLGFAKQNTYFTHSLEQSAIERRNLEIQRQEAQNAIVQSLREQLSRLHVKLVRGDISKTPPVDRPASGTTAEQIIRFNQLFTDFTPPSNKNYSKLYVYASPTDWVIPKTQESTGSRSPGTSATTPSGSAPTEFVIKDYGVGGLLESGEVTNITLKWKARLIGPFNTSSFTSTIGVIRTAEDVLNNDVIKNATSYSSEQKTVTVTTKQQWINLADPGASSRAQPPVISIFRFDPSIDEFNSWMLLIEAEITATVGTQTLRSSTFSSTLIGRNETRVLSSVLSFSWDSYFDEQIDAAKTAPSVAPAPPPGSVAPNTSSPNPGNFEFRINPY